MEHIIENFPTAETIRSLPEIKTVDENLINRALTRVRDFIIEAQVNGNNSLAINEDLILRPSDFETKYEIAEDIPQIILDKIVGLLIRKGYDAEKVSYPRLGHTLYVKWRLVG